MTDHITHERNRLFGPETCTTGDLCYFRSAPNTHEQHGKIIGQSFGALSFDVRGDDGLLHVNITKVRLDHESVGAADVPGR